tara:strand:- start:545 stop:739 length:195 start_codon:yes stop_codon:yes gene_type:complete
MEEFFQQIRDRFRSLDDEEKNLIRALVGTPEGRVLAKVLGPELMAQIRLRAPASLTPKRGLGTR